jgi:hypothetical protein|tara:strand:+ start:958 stop:3192 length:2235 start_codon:yes stop_codon:yes gene_type:complete
MFKTSNRGSIAPLALLFTLVSMYFTVAYLKNSFSQSAMEKYRYSEWKALYAAEAGLNDVGIVALPYTVGDTLLLPNGVNYGKDEKNQPIGLYKDIACSTQLIPNSTRKEYKAYSTGVAEYLNTSGTNVSIERRVYTTMVPQGFEEFMYFTDEELPIGPGNTGTVNFGSGDQLEGKVHTNGNMSFSNYGCPEFAGEVNITSEAVDAGGGIQSWGGCDEGIFEDEDGNSILDTVSTIIFPPDNSAQTARMNATKTFTADSKLFRTGKKDTLIMTEINFVEGGYWAAQWLYNIPPIGNPPVEFDFIWGETSDLTTPGTMNFFGAPPGFEPGFGYTMVNQSGILMASLPDLNGVSMDTDMFDDGDIISLSNSDGTVVCGATVIGTGGVFGDSNYRISFDNFFTSNPPGAPNTAIAGFTLGERITFKNESAPTGLDEDIEWNAMNYYHNHYNNDSEFCRAGDIQHFDFEYWNAGGSTCDIFSCPDLIYNSDYVHMSRTFFPTGNAPQVLYVKGGQVLVRGAVDGQYSIVTDDYTEYRRHDDEQLIDRVWGNIWLIDDIVFADSYSDGAVIHPMDGGSNNVLGLISGGSVIIANTRPNGARGGQYGTDIKINAAILAMNGGFLSHYWQNSLTNYHNWNDGLTYGVIADGRGGHRNLYRSSEVDGIYTGDDDDRGTVHLWGSVVQFQRGYMKRNYPGPYNTSPGVGYDKDYHYDWNLQIKPPPYFPDLQNSNNTVILKMASYGEAKTQHQD